MICWKRRSRSQPWWGLRRRGGSPRQVGVGAPVGGRSGEALWASRNVEADQDDCGAGGEPLMVDQLVDLREVDVVGFASGNGEPGDAVAWWGPGQRLVDAG